MHDDSPSTCLSCCLFFSFLSSTLSCHYSPHFSSSSCLISYIATYWPSQLCVIITVIIISLIFYLFHRGSTPRSLHDECIFPSYSPFLSPVLSIISSFHMCHKSLPLTFFFWFILILLLLITFLCHFYLTLISHLHFHPLYSSFLPLLCLLIWSVKLKFTPVSGGGTVCLLLCWMLHGRLN